MFGAIFCPDIMFGGSFPEEECGGVTCQAVVHSWLRVNFMSPLGLEYNFTYPFVSN
jgi:hypothetical protein